jgi:metal-responsive CopG/Arc/MetJ family transcriptional regulator
MKKNRPASRDGYARVSLCIPESILAKIDHEGAPGETRSSTLQRILEFMFANPPGIGTPAKIRGVVTVSVTMDQSLLAEIDALRDEGESRSRFVTKMAQFFFGI